jgi:hypothetical protein
MIPTKNRSRTIGTPPRFQRGLSRIPACLDAAQNRNHQEYMRDQQGKVIDHGARITATGPTGNLGPQVAATGHTG